jgi:hypothetical protein
MIFLRVQQLINKQIQNTLKRTPFAHKSTTRTLCTEVNKHSKEYVEKEHFEWITRMMTVYIQNII